MVNETVEGGAGVDAGFLQEMPANNTLAILIKNTN
jgi:hypothetical protein